MPNSTQAQSSPNPFPHSHCIHLKIVHTVEKRVTMGKAELAGRREIKDI